MSRAKMTADSRIPVRFGGMASDAAYLVEGRAPPAGARAAAFALGPARAAGAPHAFGCACCAPGAAVAAALAGLHRAMVVGGGFARVVVLASPEGEAAVRAALEADRLVRARFRVEK